MDFKHFDWSFKSIAKIAGLLIGGIAVFSIVMALISFSFHTLTNPYNEQHTRDFSGKIMSAQESAFIADAPGIPLPDSTGSDAEAYEVKTHNATIKTHKFEKTCQAITDLKKREDVIFENSNMNDEGCDFRFKVKKEIESEILEWIEDLKPEYLNSNIQSIKGSLETVDKQLEILESKLSSIEETLKNSEAAYDEVSRLATRKQDPESLAKIIDSKLNLIEKLSTQRLNVKAEIDRYKQRKADQLDRLHFSFFNVNVVKDLIWDWKQIKDSWKWEVKSLVNNFNGILQGMSVNLLIYLMRFMQAAVYFFISVLLIKYAWLGTKKIWHWRK